MEPIRRHLYGVFEDPIPGDFHDVYHRTKLDNILFGSIASIPLFVICYLFWRRVKDVRWHHLQHISWIRFLVYSSYLIGIAFLFTASIIAGFGIHTPHYCRTAIYFCIGFLFSGKLFMQMFLIERAHVANINYLRRRDDPVWLASTGAVAVFGLALTIWAFLNPVAYIAHSDGKCRKGLPAEVVAPLEVYEVTSYVVLTVVFINMLRRTKQCEIFPAVPEHYTTFKGTMNHVMQKVRPRTAEQEPEAQTGASTPGVVILPASSRPPRLRGLAYKSLIGTILILSWGVINSTIFYVTEGREQVWLCFTQCTMDIFLSVCVLHWLTTNTRDYERGTRPSITELPVFLGGEFLPEDAGKPMASSSYSESFVSRPSF